jgi:DNA polymerase-1
MRGGALETTFGWHLHPCRHPNSRSIVNFPVQANAAEILRLACILSVEACVEVLMPVHDALLVSSPIDQIEQTVATAKAAMARASKLVLNGFEIRVGGGEDKDIIRYPNRYMEESRGRVMWDTVTGLLAQLERKAV